MRPELNLAPVLYLPITPNNLHETLTCPGLGEYQLAQKLDNFFKLKDLRWMDEKSLSSSLFARIKMIFYSIRGLTHEKESKKAEIISNFFSGRNLTVFQFLKYSPMDKIKIVRLIVDKLKNLENNLDESSPAKVTLKELIKNFQDQQMDLAKDKISGIILQKKNIKMFNKDEAIKEIKSILLDLENVDLEKIGKSRLELIGQYLALSKSLETS